MKKYYNLAMDEAYYDKDNCILAAEDIIADRRVSGMSIRQVAFEIYSHAFVYHNYKRLPKFIRNTKLAKRAYESAANGIDLEDNGDRLERRICYSLIWCFC